MESKINRISSTTAERWIALALSAGVLVIRAFEPPIHPSQVHSHTFSPIWLPLFASVFIAGGIIQLNDSLKWFRIQSALRWSGLLLMVWITNGILFDFLAMAGLIGDPATGLRIGVNWLGMVTRIMAIGVIVVLARIVLARPAYPAPISSAIWYGYAAFVLALPYPVLRICWALGGNLGLNNPGAAGHGLAPLLLTIPWLLAAALSLLLVSKRRWKYHKLLLAAGWSATLIVASIAPSACWSLIIKFASNDFTGQNEMSIWVYCLFYGSWFFYALAAGAATRSYQLRCVSLTEA